jgi:hypothetical protein
MRWLSGTAVAAFAVLTAIVPAVGGCGFIAAGDRSPTKPNGFVLRGYVSVARAASGAAGAACQSPPSAPDIAAGAAVRVTDAAGVELTTGALATGVLAQDTASTSDYRCNFPFELRNVPGDRSEYVIVVGTRPAVSFPGADLRANKPAIVPVG